MLTQFLNALHTNSSCRMVVVGRTDLVIDVPNRSNYIYGRLDNATGEQIEIHISLIRPIANDRIYIVPENPTQPKTWRMVFWLRAAANPATPPVIGP